MIFLYYEVAFKMRFFLGGTTSLDGASFATDVSTTVTPRACFFPEVRPFTGYRIRTADRGIIFPSGSWNISNRIKCESDWPTG